MPRLLLFSVLIFAIFSCDDDNKENLDPCQSNFDQEAMFVNVADNLILPAYGALEANVLELETKFSAFAADISLDNLEQVRVAYEAAYLAFQAADLYEFGPAEDALLRSTVNNFPANKEAINANLSSGDWNLEKPDTYDKGFPALDYLLYGLQEGDEAIVDWFKADDSNGNALGYTSKVITQIKEKVQTVNSAWKQTYRDQFVKNTGTAAGTALSQIVNGLNQHYENIKRNKIGIPSGVATLGFTNPENVEALHSGISLDLAKEALEANYLLFKGLDGQGLDDYLKEISNTRKEEVVSSSEIEQQYKVAKAALAAINGKLSVAVDEQTEVVVTAYNELVKQIVKIKNDMPTALCVSITYIDNPSDSD